MKIFSAREEDVHQGWVWIKNPKIPVRSIVKITNADNGHSIYCEALQIDNNFLEKYNQPPRATIKDPSNSLVISYWYRSALGCVETKTEVNLAVEARQSYWGQYKASTHHPQVVVRLAARLAGIGLILGVIGLILGIVGLF